MSRFTSLKSFKILFSLAVLLVASANAFDLSVKANVDNAQVFIGDKFNYEIQVTAPENAIVDLPSFVGNLGSFEVKEMKNEKITEGMPKGTAKFTWLATLNTFVSGDFLIAPQEVNAVVGTDTVKTHTDPVAVKVSNRTSGFMYCSLYLVLLCSYSLAGSCTRNLQSAVKLRSSRRTKKLYLLSRICATRITLPKAIRAITSCRLGLSLVATLSAVLKSIFSMRLSRNSRSAWHMSQGSRRHTRNPW